MPVAVAVGTDLAHEQDFAAVRAAVADAGHQPVAVAAVPATLLIGLSTIFCFVLVRLILFKIFFLSQFSLLISFRSERQ